MNRKTPIPDQALLDGLTCWQCGDALWGASVCQTCGAVDQLREYELDRVNTYTRTPDGAYTSSKLSGNPPGASRSTP
jgi:hypothetical protein